MAAGPDRSAVAGIDRLDGVGATDDLADLDVVVQERHELRPGVAPQPADRRIRLAPLLLKLLEPGQRLGLGGGGVDRPQVMGDLVPVLPRREPERVPEQMDDALLDCRQVPYGGDGVGEGFEAVADRDADVVDAAVLPSRSAPAARTWRPHRRPRPT